MSCCRAVCTAFLASSSVLGRAMSRTGPPMRKVVWRLMGSSARSSRSGQVRDSSRNKDAYRSIFFSSYWKGADPGPGLRFPIMIITEPAGK